MPCHVFLSGGLLPIQRWPSPVPVTRVPSGAGPPAVAASAGVAASAMKPPINATVATLRIPLLPSRDISLSPVSTAAARPAAAAHS
jgi:hypothetical protein